MKGYVDSVSVIFPNYNHATFLRERIESVMCQLRPYDEIIFLDDASTDNSVLLAKALLANAPCNVIYKINEVNSGSTFCQWNKGFKLASKQWIWIAETDDACHPDFLKRVLGAAINNHTDFAYAQSIYIDEHGIRHASDLKRMNALAPNYFNNDFTKPGLELVERFFTVSNCIPNASAVIFNASLLRTVGYANEYFYFTGDWEFWIRLVVNRNVSFIAEDLNYFRFHPATTRAIKKNKKREVESETCRALARLLSRYPEYVGEKGVNNSRSLGKAQIDAANQSPNSMEDTKLNGVPKKRRLKFIRLDQVPKFTRSYIRLYFFYLETKLLLKFPVRVLFWLKRQIKTV